MNCKRKCSQTHLLLVFESHLQRRLPPSVFKVELSQVKYMLENTSTKNQCFNRVSTDLKTVVAVIKGTTSQIPASDVSYVHAPNYYLGVTV